MYFSNMCVVAAWAGMFQRLVWYILCCDVPFVGCYDSFVHFGKTGEGQPAG
jgi:hypothetical protein